MSHPNDDYWKELLADEDWWAALVDDDEFWQDLGALSPREQADAMMARYVTAVPHDLPDIRVLRAQQLGLVSGLVQRVGLKQARALFAASHDKEIH